MVLLKETLIHGSKLVSEIGYVALIELCHWFITSLPFEHGITWGFISHFRW